MEFLKHNIEHKEGEVPCQSCGKVVRVTLPFYGCVFCSDCKNSDGDHTADAPEFKPKYNWMINQ
jgi:hypothetical protein